MNVDRGMAAWNGAQRLRALIALLAAAGAMLLLACGPSDDNLDGLSIVSAPMRATPQPAFSATGITPVAPGDASTVVLPAATAIPAAEAVTVPTLATVTTDNLNVRTGPGREYTVLRQLQPGERIPLAGVSLDGEWVASPDVGWVFYDPQWLSLNGEFALLSFAEGFEAPEPPPALVAPAPTDTAEPTGGESVSVKLGPIEQQIASVMRGLIITDNLNVRAGPALSHPVLDRLQPGDKILVAGVSEDRAWVAATGLGWIFYRADWIDLDGDLDDLAVATDFEPPAG